MRKSALYLKRSLSVLILFAFCLFSPKVSALDATDLYKPVDGGCIENAVLSSHESMAGDILFYSASVTSHIQGLSSNEAIPYDVYGAIGSSDTKLFVWSKGTDDDLDFARHTVKSIVEDFEEKNPGWDAIVAVNGDFFDIETEITISEGEPETTMIQNGSVYKGTHTNTLGRGLVGVKSDGTPVYYTTGQAYKDNGYGTDYRVPSKYLKIRVLDEKTGDSVADYYTAFGSNFSDSLIYLATEQSETMDLSRRTVYVVKEKTYRHSHITANGNDGGTLGIYLYGEIVEIRKGKGNDKAEKGYALISVPKRTDVDELKIGATVECQIEMNGEWADVKNAVGFKQQVLAEGEILLKNCYGTYNPGGNIDETLVWTADIYDYPYCWKNRTLLGFKNDGTPVLLVIERSNHDGAYHNLGASYYESGEQLKSLGCVNGFMLDGGGSSTFVKRKADGSFENVFAGEGEGRAVGNAVILAVRDASVHLEEESVSPPETEEPPETRDLKIVYVICAVTISFIAEFIIAAIIKKKKEKKEDR